MGKFAPSPFVRWRTTAKLLPALLGLLFLLDVILAVQGDSFDNGVWGITFTDPAQARGQIYRMVRKEPSPNSFSVSLLQMQEYERDNQNIAWGPQSLAALENVKKSTKEGTNDQIYAVEGDLPAGKGSVRIEYYMTKGKAARDSANITIPPNTARFVVTILKWDYERYLNQIALDFELSTSVTGTTPANRALVNGNGTFDLSNSIITAAFSASAWVNGTSQNIKSLQSSVSDQVVSVKVRFPYFSPFTTLSYHADLSITLVDPPPSSSSTYFFDKGEGITVIVIIIVFGLWALCMVAVIIVFMVLYYNNALDKTKERIAVWLEVKKNLRPEEDEVMLPETEQSDSDYYSSEGEDFSLHVRGDSATDSGTAIIFTEEAFTSDSDDDRAPRSYGSSILSGSERRSYTGGSERTDWSSRSRSTDRSPYSSSPRSESSYLPASDQRSSQSRSD